MVLTGARPQTSVVKNHNFIIKLYVRCSEDKIHSFINRVDRILKQKIKSNYGWRICSPSHNENVLGRRGGYDKRAIGNFLPKVLIPPPPSPALGVENVKIREYSEKIRGPPKSQKY